MKLYRLIGQGGDGQLALTLAEADTPKPGPRDVLVRMRAVDMRV